MVVISTAASVERWLLRLTKQLHCSNTCAGWRVEHSPGAFGYQ
jgi:hypothetical protein